MGVYRYIPSAHLKRYIGESGLTYNTGKIRDMERAMIAAEGIKGKRLTCRQPDQAANA